SPHLTGSLHASPADTPPMELRLPIWTGARTRPVRWVSTSLPQPDRGRAIRRSILRRASFTAAWNTLEAVRLGAGVLAGSVALVLMPVLARRTRQPADHLDRTGARADTTRTSMCDLSFPLLLVGPLANALPGWWWMELLAGTVIALFACDGEPQLPSCAPKDKVG
ncbi:MAG: hypothetical protein ACRDKW_00650, partial [Actinomycetota bacterium]